MNCCKLYFIIAFGFVYSGEAARILSFNPMPSLSHDVIFRSIHDALLKRGHEIVVVTVNPIYKKTQAPENLTEIDIHNVSYSLTRQQTLSRYAQIDEPTENLRLLLAYSLDIFPKIIQTPEVQQLLKDKSRKFDLLFLDASIRISIVLSHLFQAPVIMVGPTGGVDRYNNVFGVSTHPIIYPQYIRRRLYDLTMMEKIKEMYTDYLIYKITKDTEENENRLLKRLFGPKTPTIKELEKNGDFMLFYGDQPIWEDNRPMPPSVIYIGGVNRVPEQPLPKDIKNYLDNCSQDVIYVSFGSNVNTLDIQTKLIETFIRAFLSLPYNISWKWDSEKFPLNSPNIKTFKWLPQTDFLRHPKVKLFITHAGLRSTEDAIDAGIPMIGIPMFLDQFYNSEKYVRHGIGLKLDAKTLTEQQLTTAIDMIMSNKSYEQNVIRLRNIINDQPMSPLENAVWWIEHVLRHGGVRHLRAAGAGIGWVEYYELKLVLAVLFTIISTIMMIVVCVFASFKLIMKRNRTKMKVF